jgi:hypothetical protein
VETWLVFVYFVGDTEMSGPGSVADWHTYTIAVRQHLGLQGDFTRQGVLDVFVPVNSLMSSG